MLSAVLNSEIAIEVSIRIMNPSFDRTGMVGSLKSLDAS